MDRATVNALLTGMLQSAEGVSDLLFIAGKPSLVEIHARLNDFPIDTPGSVLTPLLIEQLAGQIMNGSERLRMEFGATAHATAVKRSKISRVFALTSSIKTAGTL
jgi:hypothetical protein